MNMLQYAPKDKPQQHQVHGLTACNFWEQVLFGVNQRLRVEDVDSPLVNVRPVKTVLLLVVTGDRGLCGGYNNFVLKKVCSAAGCQHKVILFRSFWLCDLTYFGIRYVLG